MDKKQNQKLLYSDQLRLSTFTCLKKYFVYYEISIIFTLPTPFCIGLTLSHKTVLRVTQFL